MRAISGPVRPERGLRGHGPDASLGVPRVHPLGGRAAARRPRLPDRRRGVRVRLDAAPRGGRALRRMGDRGLPGRRVGDRLRGRSAPRTGAPDRLPVERERGSGLDRVPARDGDRRRPGGAPPRGLLPLRAPAEPAGVRRLGVLGAEGEGDLLLRRPRRAGVHDQRRADLSAAPPDPRRSRVPCDGDRRHGHVPPAVLVPRHRCGGRGRGLPAPSRARLAALAVGRARDGRSPLRRPPPDPAGRRPRRRPLRRRGAPARALAARPARLAACRRRSALRGRNADEARGTAVRRDRARRGVRRELGIAALGVAGARSGGGSRRRGGDPLAALVPLARSRGRGAAEPGSRSVARPRARLAAAVGGRAVRHRALVGRPVRPPHRAGCRVRVGRPRSRGVHRGAPRARLPRGAWVTYSYASLPVTADESVNPIVRYTGAIVVLASVSIPLLLASAWRGPPEEAA